MEYPRVKFKCGRHLACQTLFVASLLFWSLYVLTRNLVFFAPTVLQFSDIRLKTDIQDLTAALKIVSELQGRSYRWKKSAEEEPDGTQSSASTSTENGDATHGHRVLGFIAQELQRVVPDAVRTTSRGYLVVSYTTLVPVLVEALKEQYDQARRLPEQVEQAAAETEVALQKTMQLLRDTIDRLNQLEEARPKHLDVEQGSKKPRKSSKHRREPCRKCCSCCCTCCAKRPLTWTIVSTLISVLLIGAAVGGLLAWIYRPLPLQLDGQILPLPPKFVTTNYIGNPGFEDPASNAWAGNYSYYQYNVGKRRDAIEDVDTARNFFDAGNYAAKMYLDPALTNSSNYSPIYIQQDLNMTYIAKKCAESTDDDVHVYLSIWVHIAQKLPANRTSGMNIRFYSTIEEMGGNKYDSNSVYIASDAVNKWEDLKLEIQLDTRLLPRKMTVKLRSGVPGLVFVDYATIRLSLDDFDSESNAPAAPSSVSYTPYTRSPAQTPTSTPAPAPSPDPH
jgi:hypothetical protein